MPERVRVGTRASRLALWQTDHVIARLERAWPGTPFERVEIRTLGDRVTDVPLPRIGDRGLFTREIEDGLRAGTIDIAVHSLKDLPTESPAGLAVGAVLEREDPREVLVARDGRTLSALPRAATVGTSSLRRRAQVLSRRPDLRMTDIRGNVPTRLEKVGRGEYDATLLALAGLRRLGLTAAVTEIFEHDVLVPAPGQGALAVQCRAADARIAPLLAPLDDAPTRFATAAERALLSAVEGGCQAPLGAIATRIGPRSLRLQGLVASMDGAVILRCDVEDVVPDEAAATALGRRAADELLAQGAGQLLDETRAALAAGDGPTEAHA